MYACWFGFWGGFFLVLGVQSVIVAFGACLGAFLGVIPSLLLEAAGSPLSFDMSQNLIYAFGIVSGLITFVASSFLPILYWKKLYKYRHWA